MASASGDRSIKVWNWGEEDGEGRGRCSTTLEGNKGDVYAARWHPMGVRLLVFVSEGSETDEVAQNHIAAGGYDKIVRLFDVESGSILKTFTGASFVACGWRPSC